MIFEYLNAHLVSGEFDARVVLDLPQTLIKAFPLIRFSKLLFVLFIGQQVFRSQKCTKTRTNTTVNTHTHTHRDVEAGL